MRLSSSTIFIHSPVASIIYLVLLSNFFKNLYLKLSFKNLPVHIYIDICFQNQGTEIFEAFQFQRVSSISQGFDIFKYLPIFSLVISHLVLEENLV